MIILTMRTDNPQAEIGLFEDQKKLVQESWEAHRQLSDTLHLKLKSMLEANHLSWQDIGGIVVYEGPGSFTGLRIGISAANALAYANNIPAVGSSSDDWIKKGIDKLIKSGSKKIVLPIYGSEAHITSPKK